ncbi:hypothetical protein GCM10010112_54350 [Actinoplanes lobatus]|uniref:Uncharacterized protein n=1 Tax=Actinoplanes lobatus TaxID=113568 RepID=A0ABQ4AGZ8_9ACTN|nr:hypothetical protein GCM10010112_54350 [Actinoplanes lobatus]GIE40285.1 hypothetical protein Alo02nite_31830 [Actinoplanes lobatus]
MRTALLRTTTGRNGSAVTWRDRAAVAGRNGPAVARDSRAPLGAGAACGSGPPLRKWAARGGRAGKRIRAAVWHSATRGRGTARTGPAVLAGITGLAGAAGRNGSAVLGRNVVGTLRRLAGAEGGAPGCGR